MNTKNEANYYVIIPISILYSKDIKANEKLLYALITSLSNKEGYCYATNKYLAKRMNVNHKTISSWITNLKDKKLISVELIRDEKGRIIERKIYINKVPYPLNNRYRYSLYNGQGIHQNIEDNNKNNNIKKNNINYANQRKYSKEFFDSLYSNLN